MSKSILIIGGSSFAGRVFCIQASKNKDFRLYVVNRGQFPLNIEGVTEYKCDRNSPILIARLLPDVMFDALIDFCAYHPGEIAPLFRALKGRFKQYILFSAAGVYEPLDHKMKCEEDPVLTKAENVRSACNVYGKMLLERELIEACAEIGIPYTIFRPAYIYGPFNYAERESFFVELIASGNTVPVPTDSAARFSMVYVRDVARAAEVCIGDERAYNEIFNLAAPEQVTYSIMMGYFQRFNEGPFRSRQVTVEEIKKEHIALPFPLTEDELYSGEKFADTFDFKYTSFSSGMEKTFKIYYSIFTT
jgi:2'-hydroxyisoflavone reductase